MDLAEVRKRVEKIRALADDTEAAHAAEDSLYHDLMNAIAQGRVSEHVEQLAAAAIETQAILSKRWYA